jgi:hypothetical protein
MRSNASRRRFAIGRANQSVPLLWHADPRLASALSGAVSEVIPTTAVDFDHIVRQTEGTSQAFLKEYVLRTVQVAAESTGYLGNGVELKTEHFDIAFDELVSHGDSAGHSIMGFRTGPRGFGVKE